jgi:hypothetical protein
MKVRSLILVATLVAGFQASAMPAITGTYTCTVPGATAAVKLDFQVRDEKLFIVGMDGASSDDGMACTNETQEQNQNGVAFQTTTACNDKLISYNVAVQAPAYDTDFTMFVSLTALDANNVEMKVTAKGKNQGQGLDTDLLISCRK